MSHRLNSPSTSRPRPSLFTRKPFISNTRCQSLILWWPVTLTQVKQLLCFSTLPVSYLYHERCYGKLGSYPQCFHFGPPSHISKGLITGRTTAFLVDPENTDLAGKQNVAATQSHEVAHMWFGDIVTMKWWDNLYLNEGTAQPP